MAKADPADGALVLVAMKDGTSVAGRFRGRDTIADARRYVIDSGAGVTHYPAVESVESIEEV